MGYDEMTNCRLVAVWVGGTKEHGMAARIVTQSKRRSEQTQKRKNGTQKKDLANISEYFPDKDAASFSVVLKPRL